MKGVYVLKLKIDKDTVIRVGKLGNIRFKKGYYAYIGSALGTGGFKRVTRHFNVASGKNMTRKWHIDYLLPHSEVVSAVLIPTEENIECSVAKAFGDFYVGIPGFGCSDCSCPAHLFFSGNESIIISNTV
jgi:Uri superfamily endonuclease